MTSCFKRTLPLAGIILAFTVPFYTFTGCTEVDNALGYDIIPEHQSTVVGVDTLMLDDDSQPLIRAYVTHTDTVFTTCQGYALMGNYTSDLYGHTRTATLLQFIPATEYARADTTGNGFGIRATVDSVKLTGLFEIICGDGLVEQSFNVFQLADTLRMDTSHYATFDYSSLIDPNPIFTFKFKKEDNQNQTSLDEIKMEITPNGRIFVQRLIADTAMYNSNTEFLKNFYGLVVAPADDSDKNAAIFSSYLGNTFLDVYLHNYDEEGQVKYTDILQMFEFNDELRSNGYYYYRNLYSVASIRHDYTGTDFYGVTEEDAEIEMPNNYGYIQGLGGVNTLLKFTDKFFEAIENLKEDPTDDIMISEAVLLMDLDNDADDVEVLHGALGKLGSYFNYSSWYTIPDYVIPSSPDSETSTSYGGQLNLTHGLYELNVTTWLNQAIRDNSKREFTLAPTVKDLTTFTHNDIYWTNTIMKASAANPIKMRLTYILIK